MEIFWYIYNYRHFFFGVFRQFMVFTISSSVFIQILWFLARFEGNLKYYQRLVRTKVNQSFKTGLFAVFLFWKWKTRTAGPVFSSLFPVRSRSWIGLKTGLTNTSRTKPSNTKKKTFYRCNPGPTSVFLKMRTFWAYFKERRAKIAWVMAKTICFAKI